MFCIIKSQNLVYIYSSSSSFSPLFCQVFTDDEVFTRSLHLPLSPVVDILCIFLLSVEDRNLPNVPPIQVILPENYPHGSPICQLNASEYGQWYVVYIPNIFNNSEFRECFFKLPTRRRLLYSSLGLWLIYEFSVVLIFCLLFILFSPFILFFNFVMFIVLQTLHPFC